ncbi:MAG TPA: ABC transporter ATP-binding protein [Chthonomonadaceae bacterium]|nr:ABC transporter ATP-binding protein [Chthonomonadaceae bacterium]
MKPRTACAWRSQLKVEIQKLRKEYDNGVVGLQCMDLTITDGVFALLGPNGAGKSTLMSILATLIDPTEGTALIDGHDVRHDKDAIRQLLGYLPQDFGLYPVLSAYETLDYMALLCNMHDPAVRQKRIEELLARMNLTDVRERAVGGFSGGMRQRVGLAQALLNSPRLLIVDEPTAGLDPEERIRVRSLLAELGGERVILLSTHLIEDVEAVADRVAILHKGELRFVGDVAGMLEEVRGKVWQIDATPEELPGLRGKYLETGMLREGGRLHIRVVAAERDGERFRAVEPTLEDAYIWLMREGVDGDQ